MRRAAPASRTYGRYAIGPDGPILDPDASTRCAQECAEGEQGTRASPLTRPRSFRDDPEVLDRPDRFVQRAPAPEQTSGEGRANPLAALAAHVREYPPDRRNR